MYGIFAYICLLIYHKNQPFMVIGTKKNLYQTRPMDPDPSSFLVETKHFETTSRHISTFETTTRLWNVPWKNETETERDFESDLDVPLEVRIKGDRISGL